MNKMIKAKNPVILFRGCLAEEDELLMAKKYFPVIEQRSLVSGEYDLVIPRYSALPFYDELEYDVTHLGSKLLNTRQQHNYVANIRNWYYDLADITPRTWFYLDQIPDEGPFVLKGATNSKKHAWNTMMFAKDKRAAGEVYVRLGNDSMIGVQDICVRQYVPLNKLADGLNGLPIGEEYRFFALNGQVIGKGFYWSNHWDDLEIKPDVNDVPDSLIQKILDVVSPKINGFVFDVARTQTGEWILIELNDLQQSGPSMIDLDTLYKNMLSTVK